MTFLLISALVDQLLLDAEHRGIASLPDDLCETLEEVGHDIVTSRNITCQDDRFDLCQTVEEITVLVIIRYFEYTL